MAPRFKAFHDRFNGFDIFQRNRWTASLKTKKVAQVMGCIFVMNPFRIRFEQVIIPGLHCALEHNNRFWRIQVVFLAFARAQLMKADRIERRIGAQSERIEGTGVAPEQIFFDFLQTNTADFVLRIREVRVDNVFGNTYGFKNLST